MSDAYYVADDPYIPYLEQLYPAGVIIFRPYHAEVSFPKRFEVIAWCADQGMVENEDYHLELYLESVTGAYAIHHLKFRSKHEHHAVMFKLRWG